MIDREIWARFLAFESNIGDLASILKVERRRFLAFKEEYEGKETALLVDRYKFMDLYPCSTSELKALGYKVRLELLSFHHVLAVILTLCSMKKVFSHSPEILND